MPAGLIPETHAALATAQALAHGAVAMAPMAHIQQGDPNSYRLRHEKTLVQHLSCLSRLVLDVEVAMGQEISCCTQNCKKQNCKHCKHCKHCKAAVVEKEPDAPIVVFEENAVPEDVDLDFLMPQDLMLDRAKGNSMRDEQSTKSTAHEFLAEGLPALGHTVIPVAPRQLPTTPDITPCASRQLPRSLSSDLTPTASRQLPRTLTPDASLSRQCSSSFSRTLTPEVSKQLMRQDSKNLRGNAIGYFEVDTEIVRGISLRQTLREVRAVWLRPPATMQEEERAALYTRSRPVQHFDLFLSHTWRTPGKWKAFALLFRTGWPIMLLGNAVSVCLAFCLCATRVLPMPFDYAPPLVNFSSTSKLGCWLICLSMAGSLSGLLLSPFLPSSFGSSCFLDVVSVHQSDQQLNERGIYGIGGFLAVSREMQVLWSRLLLPIWGEVLALDFERGFL